MCLSVMCVCHVLVFSGLAEACVFYVCITEDHTPDFFRTRGKFNITYYSKMFIVGKIQISGKVWSVKRDQCA